MKINVKNSEFIKFMQEGGVTPEAAPVEEAPAAPELAGGSREELILQAAMLAVQTQDANLALLVCQALVEMTQVGGAPAAPEGQAPVYRKGGKLSRWISK